VDKPASAASVVSDDDHATAVVPTVKLDEAGETGLGVRLGLRPWRRIGQESEAADGELFSGLHVAVAGTV